MKSYRPPLGVHRPRVALTLAAFLVLFGVYIGVAQPFEAEGWGISHAFFTLAALAVVYAVLDGLASSYRRRRLEGQAEAASSSTEGTSPQSCSSR